MKENLNQDDLQEYISKTRNIIKNQDCSGRLDYIENDFIPEVLNFFKRISPQETETVLKLFVDSVSIISNQPRIRLYLTAQDQTVLKCREAIGDKADYFLKEPGGVNLEKQEES